ncbi:MAG: branched-chain amino acid ABC transporter permease [Chloroflexota bacterium]|nr:branched-chain amino acid ABC transporter permease [Chloroflexota bacterium]
MAQLLRRTRELLGHIPLLAYLLGFLATTGVEIVAGRIFGLLIGLGGAPAFFGITASLSRLDLDGGLVAFLLSIPSMQFYIILALVYDVVIYGLPTLIVAGVLAKPIRWLISILPEWLTGLMHMVTLFLGLWVWGSLVEYRLLVMMFIGVNIIMTTSLNLINGYMGEFSCGHAGFMAIGAYVSSLLTVWLFAQDDVFGAPALSAGWSVISFPFTILLGGIVAGLIGIPLAFISFRTRGDYLAIVTISFNFIIKSAIENIEFIGGPRGFMGMKGALRTMESVLNFPWLLIWTFIGVLLTLAVIYNFVSSTKGKGVVAIREDEIAAELMSVNTRHTKILAFAISSFFAGIAGGLFAHILGYINPGTFTISKSTESLVMVYLGGIGSISGSVLSATIFTLAKDALRPLEVWKNVLIWLLLILLMMFRREGIMGGKEITDFISVERLGLRRPAKEVKGYAPAAD